MIGVVPHLQHLRKPQIQKERTLDFIPNIRCCKIIIQPFCTIPNLHFTHLLNPFHQHFLQLQRVEILDIVLEKRLLNRLWCTFFKLMDYPTRLVAVLLESMRMGEEMTQSMMSGWTWPGWIILRMTTSINFVPWIIDRITSFLYEVSENLSPWNTATPFSADFTLFPITPTSIINNFSKFFEEAFTTLIIKLQFSGSTFPLFE